MSASGKNQVNGLNSRVEALLRKAEWQAERKRLRTIILGCQLTEDVKWGKLCYTFRDSNVVMIYGMKRYCALGFFKGALLKDVSGILVRPGKHSQAMRQIRFSTLREIDEMEADVRQYIDAAIEVEKSGLKIDFRERNELELPDELRAELDEDPALKAAFRGLTPGRKRGYILHVSGAKRPDTRVSRIKKCVPRILAGKGVNER